jgi:hypothetical protein
MTVSREPHPLLAVDKLRIKSNLEMHAAVDDVIGPEFGADAENGTDTDYIDAFGTLAVHEDGGATFYGRSAGSEVSIWSIAMTSILTDVFHAEPHDSES